MHVTSAIAQSEHFKLDGKLSEEPSRMNDFEINEKYNRGEIRIVTEQARYPLDNIKPMLDTGKYIRNPEYQRRKRWDDVRKSKLIESFIMNVPIPPIFLYEVEYSIYEVMDGLQRLTAIDDFYSNKFALNGLQYWQELNGRIYRTLPDQIKRGIDRRYLSSIVLLQETAKNKEEADYLKQIVFERLNSGGELLTPQETRNALYNGKFNRLCIRLAQNDNFRRMWKMPLQSEGEDKLLESIPYRKMEDVELVLRFFALRHLSEFKGVTIEKFLDEYLKQANLFTDSLLRELESIFNETVDLVFTIFGTEAFVLPGRQRITTTPVKTMYDAVMQTFVRNLDNKSVLSSHSSVIRDNIYSDPTRLILVDQNNRNLFDGRYNNRFDITIRVDFFQNFLNQFLN